MDGERGGDPDLRKSTMMSCLNVFLLPEKKDFVFEG